MSRPTILTSEIQERVCTLIAETACSIEAAAAAAGISVRSVYEWRARGLAESEGVYTQFAHALTQARDRSEANLAKMVALGAVEDWRAASWLLERRFPAKYGNRLTIMNKLAQMSEDELDAFIAGELADAPAGSEARAGDQADAPLATLGHGAL